MSSFANAFMPNGKLKPPDTSPHARSIHNKLEAILQSHPDVANAFKAALDQEPRLDRFASEVRDLIPLILEVKAGASPTSISQRPGMSNSSSMAFEPGGTLKPPTAGPHAQSIHNKLDAIRTTHPELVKEFEATLKNPSSRLPPLEQAASDLRALIPLILEVKDGTAKVEISRRQGVSGAFANAFNPNGTLKPASAGPHARSIHKKLQDTRQAHPELVLAFEAATNMPRSNSSRASTSADPIQTLLSNCLMKASTEFAKARCSMTDIARAAGVSEDALRPFFTESGPTEQGWEWQARCGTASVQAAVKENVRFGHNNREAEERSLKTVLDLLQSGHTFEEIGSVVEGVKVPDFFASGSVTARGRDFLLSLDEDQRSTYARVLNLPVDWVSPAPQASAQSPLPIHNTPGEEVMEPPRSSGGLIPSTPGDEVMGPPGTLQAEALPSVTLPGSQWSGWTFDPGTPDEVMGPASLPQPAVGPSWDRAAGQPHPQPQATPAIPSATADVARTGGRALQHQRQASPVLESNSPPTAKQVQDAKDIRKLIPLIREVKAGKANVAQISRRQGMSTAFANAFNPNGTLKLPSANANALSIHNKLRAIRQSHREVVDAFEAALKEPSSQLPPLEQAASDLRDLIPLILEVKDSPATLIGISRRPGVSRSFAKSFNPEGTLKQASAKNRNAQAIRNKLNDIRQTHRALFRQFTATTNMPRTSNNSPASTEAGPKQTLVSGGLMRASTEFAKASSSMADMARAAGLSEEAFHPFFTEFGP
ncbi:MAG: hypothetical protein JF606_27030, partial [Burkholderiales bacterium]|nr:hypothetical protein [Burkholderiales bacterium]